MAAALKAPKLILLTDVEGVKDKEGQLISTLKLSRDSPSDRGRHDQRGHDPQGQLLPGGPFGGVEKAHIIDGRVENAVILELFTDQGVGTEIT